MGLLLFLAIVGCSGDDAPPTGDSPVVPDETGDSAVEGDTADTGSTSTGLSLLSVEVEDPAERRLRLVQVVVLHTSQPTRASLILDDGERVRDVVFPELTTEHRLPVLGLPPGTHDVSWSLVSEDGELLSGSVPVTIDPIDVLMPDLTVRGDSAEAEPGYTLMGIWSGERGRIVAVDGTGRVAWLTKLGGIPKAAALTSDGQLTALVNRMATTRDLAGNGTVVYGPEDGKEEVDYTVRDEFHHEMVPTADGGFWSLQNLPIEVDAFPLSEDQLFDFAPATIADEVVVRYDAEGTLLDEWSMASLLATERVGYHSHLLTEKGYDWGHGNALVPLDDGGFVVSLRHQDAVVAVDAQGSVDWILANPDGWPAELEALRLQPEDPDMVWPYHAHGVKVEGDLVYLFDNGNEWRSNPYTQDRQPGGLVSRLVAYRIDPVAMTVEQLWEVVDEETMFSKAMGNAQLLPTTGHVLGTYPYQPGIAGVLNDEAGLGEQVTRVIEWDLAEDRLVWGLDLTDAVEDAPAGWLADRATRIPSLYMGIATETWRTSTGG